MGRGLLMVIVLVLTAVPVMAQLPAGGAIWVADSQVGTSCNLIDDGSGGLCQYYVMHGLAPGASGCQFQIQTGHTGMRLPDGAIFPVTIGQSNVGVSVGYGPCYDLSGSPLHVLTLQFLCTAPGSPACTTVEVIGHPTATPPGLLAVNCASDLVDVEGHTSYLNNDGSCTCDIPTPAEETSWGKIKALYGR